MTIECTVARGFNMHTLAREAQMDVRVEYLGPSPKGDRYWNLYTDDIWVDDLTHILDNRQIEWRLI
jgi:hypothetical protein